ncbi:MAG: hypothetical protein DCC59_17835 [Chloroflexi bacterium]|nr:MAG: hypothetical protein DCC59_17835 [Chloroflexota bacterium]
MDRQRRRVVTFGEAMVRLTPPGNERIERTRSLDLSPGGAELNAGVTLVCLGYDVRYVTKLPDNPVGRYLVRCAREAGVDTSLIQLAPESEGRCGLYFLEEGTDPRPSAVVDWSAGRERSNLPHHATGAKEAFFHWVSTQAPRQSSPRLLRT